MIIWKKAEKESVIEYPDGYKMLFYDVKQVNYLRQIIQVGGQIKQPRSPIDCFDRRGSCLWAIKWSQIMEYTLQIWFINNSLKFHRFLQVLLILSCITLDLILCKSKIQLITYV